MSSCLTNKTYLVQVRQRTLKKQFFKIEQNKSINPAHNYVQSLQQNNWFIKNKQTILAELNWTTNLLLHDEYLPQQKNVKSLDYFKNLVKFRMG